MRAAWLITVKDLKLRLRDRSAIVIGIVAPLALAVIFDLVFGPGFDATLDLDYGVVDQDRSQVSAAMVETLNSLEDAGVLTITSYPDPAGAEAAIEAGEIQAFILLPTGLGEAVFSQQPATIDVVGDIDFPTSTQIAASIASQFGEGVAAAQLSVATAAALSPEHPSPDQLAAWGAAAATLRPAFAMTDLSAETRQLDAATYLAAGMAVFFLFFTVQFGVAGILDEERQGTMARLLAAPIHRSSVITGKAILSFALGVISMTVLVVASRLLTGARWGHPLGVALLVMTGVLAATAIMGVVAAVAKTPEGAGNLGAIIAVILGMLGGTFFPVGREGDLLDRLSYLTPHAWFLRGLGDISGGAPWTAALPAAGAILLFAVVFGLLAWVLLWRKVQT
ncbi:MAG TPA: ABC transporter permease [Acidimicrobiia bacterium]|nr:ABC transporter permease [Acidimicrobiia bacterium]